MYSQRIGELVPKKIDSLYQGRIRQFTDPNGQYRDLNLAGFLDRARINDGDHVRLEVYSVPDLKRPLFKDAIADADWKEASIGQSFGPSWSTHWFKVEVLVPPEWKAKYHEPVLFDFDSSDEGFLYLEDGTPQVGLSAEHKRREWTLPAKWNDGKWHTFFIETACNNVQGLGGPPDPNRYFRLNSADLVVPRAEARALNIDFWIIGDASRELSGDSWQKHRALDVLNRIINVFDRDNVDESIEKARKLAQEYLGPNVDSSKVYGGAISRASSANTSERNSWTWSLKRQSNGISSRPGAPVDSEVSIVYAMGNCHIDTAWLWPFAETRRKIARSWASQLDLIERYPEYQFSASQATQFLWLLQDHPKLFDRVKSAVKDGRFIPIGGAWVECDTNMPSGESLARQLLLGQSFFKKHFGMQSRTFWLPDTFGYAPQLPQLCRLAGMDRFLTQKLSWNNINVFPNSTFNWVGIDGSQVLCHMPPANTYTAEAHFGDVKRSISQHKNLDTSQHGLLLFGHGDGGGGPTAEMLEKLRRCRGLSDTVGELPRVHVGTDVDSFYDEVMATTNQGADLVSWVGELYLEYHRGTYTTQANIKAFNREAEVLMHDIELLAASASIYDKNYEYPWEAIESLWQLVCQNQFHDVLPGSSIGEVYKEARGLYKKVFTEGYKLRKMLLEKMQYEPDSKGPGINTLPWDRKAKKLDSRAQVSKKVKTLSNDWLEVTFKDGVISKIFDHRACREILVPGTKSGSLVLFEDQPMNFPAWDTEIYATEKGKILVPESDEFDGNTHISHYKFGKSKATAKTTLHNDEIRVNLDVSWHETYQFLKAEWHPDIVSDFATYETAFGMHRRPTHHNTSWEAAKFEVCGHKFADLSDWAYGVSLLSNSKYGYSIHGKTMRLSLLRSPKSPDGDADMGHHSIEYRFLAHQGPVSPQVIRAAYEFNYPALAYKPRDGAQRLDNFSVDSPNVIISAIKRAESDKGTSDRNVIVRVYEAMGGRNRVKLSSIVPVKKVTRANLLEDPVGDDLEVLEQKDVEFEIKPFEVVTLRLQVA